MNWTTTTPIPDEFIKGALELERTAQGILPHRLPATARAQANNDPQLLMAESQPSGVRVAFRTDATELELETVQFDDQRREHHHDRHGHGSCAP